MLVVYEIKSPFLFLEFSGCLYWLCRIAVLLTPLWLTIISLLVSLTFAREEFKENSLESIGHESNSFLPNYLGYFFVAFSVPTIDTLVFAFAVLSVFAFFSQAMYFNPILLLLRYNFYSAETSDGTSIFIISRGEYRVPRQVAFDNARRINDFTFLEIGEK